MKSILLIAILVGICVGIVSCSPDKSGDKIAEKTVFEKNPPVDPILASVSGDSIHIGGGVIDVTIQEGHYAVTHAQLLQWVETAAKGVTAYLGKFPVKRVRIVISPGRDDDQFNGAEYDGSLIRTEVGGQVSQAQLADDWVMTHEMLHLAFPSLPDKNHWMNEGLSVYLEPVVRARAGIVTEKRYWRELRDGLETGQPQFGEGGLDQTPSWSRTYWGGTIYWFLVDIGIREQTQGKKSIDDVVRALLDQGGDGSQDWSMQRVLDAGDAVTGTHVMHDVYDRLALKPERVSFDQLWQKLGVRFVHGDVEFDDTAPLAGIRKAITSK